MKYLAPKKDHPTFFALFRKRGFIESLSVLKEQNSFELSQKDFFNILVSKDAYPNLFFRVKKELLENKIIGFKLDKDNEKVLYLTEKGKRIMELIDQIENLVSEPKQE